MRLGRRRRASVRPAVGQHVDGRHEPRSRWSAATSRPSRWTPSSTPRTPRSWAVAASTARSTLRRDPTCWLSAASSVRPRCRTGSAGRRTRRGEAAGRRRCSVGVSTPSDRTGRGRPDDRPRLALIASDARDAPRRRSAGLGRDRYAFPAVSAGVYGWDADEVALVAVDAVRGAPAPGVELVRFVLFSERTRRPPPARGAGGVDPRTAGGAPTPRRHGGRIGAPRPCARQRTPRPDVGSGRRRQARSRGAGRPRWPARCPRPRSRTAKGASPTRGAGTRRRARTLGHVEQVEPAPAPARWAPPGDVVGRPTDGLDLPCRWASSPSDRLTGRCRRVEPRREGRRRAAGPRPSRSGTARVTVTLDAGAPRPARSSASGSSCSRQAFAALDAASASRGSRAAPASATGAAACSWSSTRSGGSARGSRRRPCRSRRGSSAGRR